MTTSFRLERSPQVGRDLRMILQFLMRSNAHFGEPFERARTRAAKRVQRVEAQMEGLAKLPYQGTRRDDWMRGLRTVTKERAIFYFAVDEGARVVRVLAVFFGGQDHRRAMLRRLLSE